MIASPANTASHVEHSMNGPNGTAVRRPARRASISATPTTAPRTNAPNPATTRCPQPSHAAYPPTSAASFTSPNPRAAPLVNHQMTP